MIIDDTTSKLDSLISCGFEEAGNWILENDKLKYKLHRYSSASQILYAFISGGELCYIGKSVQTLAKRMYGYQNPGNTQRTNIANHDRLLKELQTQASVQIWALVITEPYFYRGFTVNIAAGLEDGLIVLLNPPWNIAGNRRSTEAT